MINESSVDTRESNNDMFDITNEKDFEKEKTENNDIKIKLKI